MTFVISSPRRASAAPGGRLAAAALSLAALAALSGCAAEPGPSPTSTVAESTPTPAEASPTPSAAFALPSTCDAMLGDALETQVGESDLQVVNASGPEVTADTWDGSEEFVLLEDLGGVACGYHFTENGGGVDGTGQVYTAVELSPDTRAQVVALLDQGDYEKTEEDGRSVYTRVGSVGETVEATVVHEVSDDVWLSGRWNASEVMDVREVLSDVAENVGAW